MGVGGDGAISDGIHVPQSTVDSEILASVANFRRIESDV